MLDTVTVLGPVREWIVARWYNVGNGRQDVSHNRDVVRYHPYVHGLRHEAVLSIRFELLSMVAKQNMFGT